MIISNTDAHKISIIYPFLNQLSIEVKKRHPQLNFW